jgi:hypothetical protein
VRLGLGTWKAVHWLAYASWPVALVHAFGTGSDARSGWFALVGVAAAAAVVAAVLLRVAQAHLGPPPVRLAAGAAALVVPALIAGWAATGPLEAGWARRAGTPTRLLAARPVATRTNTTASSTALPATPYEAPVRGSYSTSAPGSDGLVTVGMSARAAGGAQGLLHVVLKGVPLENGGVQMTNSSVDFGPAGSPSAYSGTIVSLAGSRMVASVQDARGDALDLTLTLRLDSTDQSVRGSLRVA